MVEWKKLNEKKRLKKKIIENSTPLRILKGFAGFYGEVGIYCGNIINKCTEYTLIL